MHKCRPVRIEELLLPRILKVVDDLERASLPADEARATIGMQPIVQAMFDPLLTAPMFFGVMARTAVLFTVDHDEFVDVLVSAGAAPLTPELPPLPYPRIAAECIEDETWSLHTAEDDGFEHPLMALELFMVNETIQGERWDVVYLLSDPEEYVTPKDRRQYTMLFSVFQDGSVKHYGRGKNVPAFTDLEQLSAWMDKHDPSWDEIMPESSFAPDHPVAISSRTVPIEFAHLINAHGVTLEPVLPTRHDRRSAQRRGFVFPQVYLVEIKGGVEESGGRSDREYHCRWMVRGHWRRYKDGRKTWVRPYIKGPAGAPWKGRPVYVLASEQ